MRKGVIEPLFFRKIVVIWFPFSIRGARIRASSDLRGGVKKAFEEVCHWFLSCQHSLFFWWKDATRIFRGIYQPLQRKSVWSSTERSWSLGRSPWSLERSQKSWIIIQPLGHSLAKLFCIFNWKRAVPRISIVKPRYGAIGQEWISESRTRGRAVVARVHMNC